jgi:hypothetical protein
VEQRRKCCRGLWNNEQPKVAAFVTGAQKSLATIQKDYSFFASIVITGGALVGITITQADMEKVKAWVAAADANLSVVGPVVSGQPMDGGAVQNAIIATNKVIPALKADALKSETIAALYNAWLAAQAAKAAAQPAPAPAPAK